MSEAAAGRRTPSSVPGSRHVVWLLLGLPAAIQTYRYWQDAVFYGEYLHWTGQAAAQILIVVLAITPLRLALPRSGWVRWLAGQRRYIGVAVFAYSLLHTLAYLFKTDAFERVIDDALGFPIGSGWIALLVFAVLAATSNDASVRRLGRGWKSLHRAVYAGAALTFAHWLLTAFDPLAATVHLAVLAAVLAIGFLLRRRARTN